MSPFLDDNTAETGVFNLGPMDGQQQPIEKHTDEPCVAMTDGQQHRYLRSNERNACLTAGRQWSSSGQVATTGQPRISEHPCSSLRQAVATLERRVR